MVVCAETVQFLGGGGDAPSGGNGNGFASSVNAVASEIPVDTVDFVPASVGSGVADDDIPF